MLAEQAEWNALTRRVDGSKACGDDINFLGDNSTPNGSLKLRFEGPKCSGAKLELKLEVVFQWMYCE